jgi:hypothetical protein
VTQESIKNNPHGVFIIVSYLASGLVGFFEDVDHHFWAGAGSGSFQQGLHQDRHPDPIWLSRAGTGHSDYLRQHPRLKAAWNAVNQTLQDRFVKEMHLLGISSRNRAMSTG